MLRVDRGTRLFEWLLSGSGNNSEMSSTLVRLCDHVKRLQGAGTRSSACQTDDAGSAPASERLYDVLQRSSTSTRRKAAVRKPLRFPLFRPNGLIPA